MTAPTPSPGRTAHALVHLTHPDTHTPGYEMPDTAAPPPTRRGLIVGFLAAVVVALVGFWLEHACHNVEDAHVAVVWVVPFGVLLICIAAMPFLAGHFWERYYSKVAVGLGLLVAGYYVAVVEHGPGNMGRSMAEYISFIFLLGSLFVVSGGILIRVRTRATPAANVVLLLIGAIIANLFGTTGASMLLIRPFLRMNKRHLRPYHVVFFIFIVSNTGGSLTPIGDPPLFLGYLMGVPFSWVFEHFWPIWTVVNGLLLAVFWAIDARACRGEAREPDDGDGSDDTSGPGVSLYGATNLLFVGLIIAGILLHGSINAFTHRRFGFEAPWRELLMAIAAFGSLVTTPRRIHGDNHFNYAPIKEVAYLFIGIFLTMVPALNYLSHNSEKLHLTRPGQYYFAAGGLSSVLDNAPTYLTFLKTEMASLDNTSVDRVKQIVNGPGFALLDSEVFGLTPEQAVAVRRAVVSLGRDHAMPGDPMFSDNQVRVAFLTSDPRLNLYLVGISMGAVLFGAMTYIGNGPNFMVKSIATHAGAETPGFFRYVFAFSLPVLVPILVLVWVLFLR